MQIIANKAFGFSYLEVLITIVLIAIALIPAMQALQTAQIGSGVFQSQSSLHFHLNAKLEEVLAKPYSSLMIAATASASSTVPTSFSDVSGSNDRRLVYLFGFDADDADGDSDPFTGVDNGLLWIRVEVEGTSNSIETLTFK